jgi:hypothetical protein
MMVVLGLAVARLRRHPGRGLLTALGVALAATALVATLAIRTLAGDLALRQAITDRPPGDRSATVSRSQSVDDLRPFDTVARAALARLHAGATRREMMLRVLSDGHGGLFRLAAIDGVASSVRLTSGRLPGPCRNGRCEVLLIGSKQPVLDPSLGVVVTGHATLTDPVLLAGTFDPGPDVPVLLGSDVDGLNAHQPTVLFQRSYGWVASLDPDTLRVAGLGSLLRATAAAATDAEEKGMVLTAPDDALTAAAARARASSRRLLLVGGQLVAVLAAFVALAALGLRDDHAAARTLLARRGASRRQSLVFTAAEAGWPVLAGLVPGVLAGVGVAYAVAAHESVPGGQLVRDALAGSALVPLIVLVLGLWLLLAGILRTSEAPLRRGIRASDVAAVVLAAVALLAASRGHATAERLGDQGDPLLALLPALVAGAGGLAAMRLVAPALAGLARIAPSRSGLARVGVADALRRPARPLATVAFLVAACALAIFATAYRSTLRAGAADQAAFGVPLDARLTTGESLALPLDVAPLDRYRALAPDGLATTVLRRAAVVRTSGTAPDPIALLGLDASVLPHLARFRTDPSPATLADRIGRVAYRINGTPLPPGATSLRLDATGTQNVSVSAIVARPDGVQGTVTVPGPIPAQFRGGTFIGLQIREQQASLSGILHHIGEGATEVEKRQVAIDLSSVIAEPGGPLPLDLKTWVAEGGSIDLKGAALAIRSGLDGGSAIVRAPQPVDGLTLPVITDPITAAAADGGDIDIDVPGAVTLPGRIVATLPRFPTAGERFVVADEQALQQLLDSYQPGTGTPGEVWVGGSGTIAPAVRAAPFNRLDLDVRAEDEARLVSDPLARGAAALLLLAALAAAAVAVVAVALVVRSDLASGADDLLTLEADGATPGSLRGMLAIRTGALVLIALVPGLICGVILTRAVTRLVTVTATGSAPEPPLVASGSGLAVVGVVVAVAVIALIAVAIASALALREPLPPRPAGAGS